MEADVQTLADDDMQGRGLGSAGHEAAAEYIAEQFRAAGLEPASPEASARLEPSAGGPGGGPTADRGEAHASESAQGPRQ